MRVTRSSSSKRNATPLISTVLKASKAGVAKNRKATKSTIAGKVKEGIHSESQLVAIPSSRPADPTITSAPLVVHPKDKSVVAFPLNNASTSAGNVLQVAQQHLQAVDPRMTALVEKHHCTLFSPESLAEPVDPFHSLVSAIIGQQVSGAAATSIKAKFVALFELELAEKSLTFPTPSMVLACDHTRMRSAGCSNRKAEYLHSLAEHFENGELTTEILMAASDDEVIERLTKVRGIGAWSAQMFLMFSLKRMDVFSIGDLGIQRGMAAFEGRDVNKLKTTGKGDKKWKYMSEADMLRISEKFRPYRSLFMWYMWKASDTSVAVLASDSKKKGAAKRGKAKKEEEAVEDDVAAVPG